MAGLLSDEEACQKFKITIKPLHQGPRCGSSPGYDKYFVQPYRAANRQNPQSMSQQKLSDKEKIEMLEQQLRDAHQQLEHERLKSEAWKTMIGIAEENWTSRRSPRDQKKHGTNSPENEKQIPFYRLRGTLWPRRPRLLGLSRQAYYHAIKQKKKEDEKAKLMIEKVKKIREDLPGTGTRRLPYLTVSYRKKHGINRSTAE